MSATGHPPDHGPDLNGVAAGLSAAQREALCAFGRRPDDEIDLAEAALALAACVHPGTALDPYRDHLHALKASVADSAARGGAGLEDDSVEGRAALLRAALVEQGGYLGDAEGFDDPDNADLMRVIDRRRGVPVSLGVLWLHVARAQGWEAHGLNFPGHFLMRLDCDGGERLIIDPFHGGRVVDVAELRALLKAVTGPAAELTPQVHSPLGNRDILVRLHNTIKMRHLDAGSVDRALATVEQILLLAPRDHRLWREAGLMHMRLGDLERALDRLDTYLSLAPPGTDRDRIADVLAELRSRMN